MTSKLNTDNLNSSSKNAHHNHTHSLVAAGVSGFFAGYAGFPFEGLKKRLQSNQSLPNVYQMGIRLWFKESFRGVGSYAFSNIPASVAQQMTNHYFEQQTTLSDTFVGKTIQVIFSGAVGGIPATLIGNTLLEQQLKKITTKEAFFNLINEHGYTRLFRGASMTMVREAMFGFCYLKAMDDASQYATSQWGSAYALPAQMSVGVCGSLLSHPFDTIATTMQRYNYRSIYQASEYLWNQNKMTAFYKGGLARVGLFTSTMWVINKSKQMVLEQLEDSESTSSQKPGLS